MEDMVLVWQGFVNITHTAWHLIVGFIFLMLFSVLWICFKEALCAKFVYWHAKFFASTKKGSS
jgi:hypothetical protein